VRDAVRAWGRLLRLSLAPTAAADVVAGALVAGRGEVSEPGALALAAGGSLCVYHAGMALNDWRDRAADVTTRPDRPLVSGAVGPGAALAAVVLLNALGITLAALAAPLAGAWLAGVALLATLYDLAGRGPVSGPLLLALCRGGNLSLGFWIAGAAALAPASWSAPLLYAVYVFVVSRLGRLEDREERGPAGSRPRRYLLTGAALLAAVPLLPLAGATLASRAIAALLTLLAAAGLARRARSVGEWTPAAIGASMGLALRRLLVVTAACAALTGTVTGLAASAVMLLGYPLSYWLREVFPPS
jgi:4-hydroxybenzoate polyprenyltransferase